MLPTVTRTDVTFEIMEICLLWQRFDIGHFLHDHFQGEIIKQSHKQKPVGSLDTDLLEQLERMDLLPRIRERRIVRKGLHFSEMCNMLHGWTEGVKRQSQGLDTIMKELGELHIPGNADIELKERNKQGLALARKCATELHSTIALICAAPTLLQKSEGIFPGEEQPRRTSIATSGIRTTVQQILEDTLRLKQLVVTALKSVLDTENRYEAFRLHATDHDQSLQRLSKFITSIAEFGEASKIPMILIACRLELAGMICFPVEDESQPAQVRRRCEPCSSDDADGIFATAILSETGRGPASSL